MNTTNPSRNRPTSRLTSWFASQPTNRRVDRLAGTASSADATGSHPRRADERGVASIEAVLVALGLGLFISLVILGGRVELAKQAVQSAAYDAARTASISRTSAQAATAGRSTANASLAQQGIHCTRSDVTINTNAFTTALGTTGAAALVRATVTCTIDVSGLGLPGINQHTINETMTSPLDAYRGRS